MARSTSSTAEAKSAPKKAAKKATTATKSPATSATKKSAAKKSTSTKSTAKKTTAKTTTTKASSAKAGTGTAKKKSATKAKSSTKTTTRTRAKDLAPRLVVREDESPWTKAELKAVRKELDSEVARLREDIEAAESDLVDLMRDHADGAGDDQADQGAKTFEREQEISLANNARAMLVQNLHALERLEDGSYGRCESCGNAIGKMRLQAYPRATQCVSCKSKQERR